MITKLFRGFFPCLLVLVAFGWGRAGAAGAAGAPRKTFKPLLRWTSDWAKPRHLDLDLCPPPNINQRKTG